MKNFIPLSRPTLPTVSSVTKKISKIFSSGMITEHIYVHMFEKKCSEYLGVKHAVTVSSGTSALILTLQCLKLKGEIILPSFTYTSDAHALSWCGLTPVFADINRETFTLDPTDVERKITKHTSAIMPTHVFGNPCDITAFTKLSKKYKIKILYDAAHAFGSTYKNISVGSFGDAAIFSLTPTKVLTTGEGGLITTNNTSLSNMLRLAKFNGDNFDRSKEFLGMTSRMSEFQAIIGIENLKIFSKQIKRRLMLVNFYKKRLSKIRGISFQKIDKDSFSVYKDMTMVIDEHMCGFTRDDILKTFGKNKIQTKVYFYPPLHKKKVYEKYADTVLPNTEYVSNHIINLPLYSNMSIKDIDRVCCVVESLVQR